MNDRGIHVVRAHLAKLPPPTSLTIAERRAQYDKAERVFPTPPDVKVERVEAPERPAEWLMAPGVRADAAVLYLHGGGYVIGSPRSHRHLAAAIGRAAGVATLLPDYRLAPEHPFPAAVEDAVAAYRWLLGTGVAPSRVAIAGDSAGGGLTLATLLALRDRKLALPACGVCLSPWVDLEGTGKSAQPGGADDPLLELEGLREMGQHYAAKSLRDPLAAPLHADFRDLPPLLIQVGTRELLLDDSTRVAEKAKAAGVDVTLEPWEGLIHVWQLFGPSMPEAVQAVDRIGEFTRKHTG
jgi:monoterpene epsilon-lactone hydrolase